MEFSYLKSSSQNLLGYALVAHVPTHHMSGPLLDRSVNPPPLD